VHAFTGSHLSGNSITFLSDLPQNASPKLIFLPFDRLRSRS
jgi:hypothetical protein